MTTHLPSTAWLRRCTLVLGSLLGIGAAQAQSLNYVTTNASNVAGTFTSIATTGTAIATANTDNANSGLTNIGFTFSFNGATFTQFVLNTNGFIKLGGTPSSASLFFTPETTLAGDVFSSTNAADVNIIAPFNCDLESSGTTAATYQVQTTGTAGSRVCTIQWTGVRDKLITNSPQYLNFNFQAKLYEGSNRVELVYDLPTAGTGTDALRYAGAGIKGSGAASGQVLTFTKTSASLWSTATVQNTIYTLNALNYRQTVLPDAGRTFRFNPTVANDAAVAIIWTYGKLPKPAALPHAVQAVITNTGTAAQTNLVATLNVTGANTFTDTKTIATLAAGASATVTFASYPTTFAAGTNLVTVTLPNDDNISNNTSTYGQLISANRLTYIDPNAGLFATGVGVGQAGGALVAKYTLTAASNVSDVVLTFAASANNVSTYQVLLYDANGAGGVPGAVLYTSPTQTRTAAAGATTIAIPGTAVPANFYVGVKELNTNPALAYQVEDPLKPNTYYYSLDAATGWTSVNTTTLRTRMAIEVGLGAAAACASPGALTVGTVTATTASLTFTPVTGAVNYTLTYTPAGGTAQTQTITGSPINLTNLTAGTTYTVSLVTNCGGTAGSSTAATTTFATPVAPPANDECAGAITLTSGGTCVPTSGTTAGATQSLPAITCANFTGNADDDVWYKFTATGATHTVTVVGSTAFDAVVDVRSGACPGVNIGCADATVSGGTETVVLTGLMVGSVYYVRVYSYGSTATTPTSPGAFTICITNPTNAPCAAVTNAAVTTTGGTATASTGELTFTPVTGATNYFLTLTPTAGGTQATATVTASPVTLTGLTPNTSYTITITTNCSNGGMSSTVTVIFTSAAAPAVPANDDPAGAITLTVSSTCTPTNGTNAGATTTTASGYANPGTCGIAVSPKDVWYKFTTLAGQTVATVTVTGSPAGLVRVFSASSSAGPFTQVNCSAGSTNNTVAPALTVTGLTPNTTYYISVAGYGSADTQGAFTICVTGTATGCPAPTGLALTNLSATSATLTFTAAAGATNYTVIYTPAGGTAQTQTVTASPVTLVNLTPNTLYNVSVITNCTGGQTSPAVTTTFSTSVLAVRSALAGGYLTVFPNPAHRVFTLSLPALNSSTAHLELVNTLGQAVRQQTVTLTAGGTLTLVDVSELATGVYTVRVRAGNETAITRLVIE